MDRNNPKNFKPIIFPFLKSQNNFGQNNSRFLSVGLFLSVGKFFLIPSLFVQRFNSKDTKTANSTI
jgi:hypothetical protein